MNFKNKTIYLQIILYIGIGTRSIIFYDKLDYKTNFALFTIFE